MIEINEWNGRMKGMNEWNIRFKGMIEMNDWNEQMKWKIEWNKAHKANDGSSYLIEWLYDDVITWDSFWLLLWWKPLIFIDIRVMKVLIDWPNNKLIEMQRGI